MTNKSKKVNGLTNKQLAKLYELLNKFGHSLDVSKYGVEKFDIHNLSTLIYESYLKSF